jgi:hypothetical protein
LEGNPMKAQLNFSCKRHNPAVLLETHHLIEKYR